MSDRVTTVPPSSSHPGDAVLQQLLDAALGASAASAIRAHLRDCADCRRRLHALQTNDGELAGLLALLDVAPPVRSAAALMARARRRPPALVLRAVVLRAAAVVLLAVGMAVSVAVAMPGSSLGMFMRTLLPARAVAPAIAVGPRPAPAPRQAAPAAGVGLIPVRDAAVVFEAGQQTGSIRVTITDAPSLRVRHAGGDAAYLVTGDSVLVANRGSTASYEVLIPASVARVRVWVDGRALFIKRGSELTAGEPLRAVASPYDILFHTPSRR